jgi:hypothetical protein
MRLLRTFALIVGLWALLEPRKERLGLQAGRLLQLLMHLGPDLGERVFPCPPDPLGSNFAGESPMPPILPRRLLVHACPTGLLSRSVA